MRLTFAERPDKTHHAPPSDSNDMSQTFAQVVERVKQLSVDEKQELLELLDGWLEGTEQKAKVHVSEYYEERSGKKPDLAELVSGMPADDQATEEGFGQPVGKEEW